MGMSNRRRDFSEETINAIRENLKSPTEPYRELSNWWREYGTVFETADPTPEIERLENHMTEFRELMGVTAPKELDRMLTEVAQVQTTFVTQSNEMKELLIEYGKAVDILIETISDRNFATNFNKAEVLAKIYEQTSFDEEDTARDAFIADTMAQYGFDEETAKIMWKVWEGINDKYPNESDEYIAWVYNRIMGGFYYGAEGLYDAYQWEGTAGKTPVTSGIFYFLGLGLSVEEYRKLSAEIRTQHLMLEMPITPLTYDDLFLEEGEKTYKKLKKQLEEIAGKNLSKDEVEELFKQYYEKYIGVVLVNEKGEEYIEYKNYGDFAHQSITISAILAEQLELTKVGVSDLATLGKKSEMAGWLGDATLNETDGKTHFTNDDYLADLDAENIVYYMNRYGLSYIAASKKYYADIKPSSSEEPPNAITRATIFLEHTSIDYVESNILYNLYFGLKMPLADREYLESLPIEVRREIIEKEIKELYPETYRFLQSLWEKENEMVP